MLRIEDEPSQIVSMSCEESLQANFLQVGPSVSAAHLRHKLFIWMIAQQSWHRIA